MPYRSLSCFLAFLSSALLLPAASRSVVPFNTDWRFVRSDPTNAAAPAFRDKSWERVTLPHTYNTEDALPGKSMFHGPVWYRKEFKGDSSWKEKRVFIRFGAASLIAEVFLNGTKLGEHRGGFSAFCFELTSGLKFSGKNILAVRVTSKKDYDLTPVGGDFTIFGDSTVPLLSWSRSK